MYEKDHVSKHGGPLKHLRVLDLTQFLAGPYGTQILGDLGAEVIKVESLGGDMTRRLPPHFVGSDSCYYLSVNRNKQSLALDLKTDRGKAVIRELALACDVVVENFRPGVLRRLGLSYQEIAEEKPSIVWCSISGFGQDGPYRDRPAYDMIVQAMSGGMSITGEADGLPVRSGIPLGDISAGMYSVIGILAAVESSRRTGVGRYVDISMLDCQVAMLCYQAAYYLHSGQVPGRQGRGHDSIPTYRSFICREGTELVITANTERMWRSLCSVLGVPEMIDDPRFLTNDLRFSNRYELWPLLERAFHMRPAAEWVDLLLKAEIPAATIAQLDQSLDDPQIKFRSMLLHFNQTDGEQFTVVGNPIKFNGEDEPKYRAPPRLGADADDILSEVLGMSPSDIIQLRDDGIISTTM